MSDLQTIHVGDTGTSIRILVTEDGDPVNISSATVKKLKFLKKDKTTLVVDASFLTDGLDGYLEYKTVDGDIDMAGQWKVQAYLEIGTWKGHTEKQAFIVSTLIE